MVEKITLFNLNLISGIQDALSNFKRILFFMILKIIHIFQNAKVYLHIGGRVCKNI